MFTSAQLKQQIKQSESRVAELEGMLLAKDQEIDRLVQQNDSLHQKFLALLDPNALMILRRTKGKPPVDKQRNPMKVDEQSGELRPMTSQEMGEVMQGFKELGIF